MTAGNRTHAERKTSLVGLTVVHGGSPGELSEELVTWEKRKKGWKMNCDVGEAMEGLETAAVFQGSQGRPGVPNILSEY